MQAPPHFFRQFQEGGKLGFMIEHFVWIARKERLQDGYRIFLAPENKIAAGLHEEGLLAFFWRRISTLQAGESSINGLLKTPEAVGFPGLRECFCTNYGFLPVGRQATDYRPHPCQ